VSTTPRDLVTVDTWIECGLRLGLTAPHTLALYRAHGGRIRNGAFMEQWRMIRAQFVAAGIDAKRAAEA
jgi:hypothetical protein